MRPLRPFIAGLLLMAAASAARSQAIITSKLQYTWTATSAASTGQLGQYIVFNGLNAPRPFTYRIDWTVSGTAPSGCTFNAQGSADNVTWTNVDGVSAVSCTASGAEIVTANPVLFLRINLVSFTAGDSTTVVTFHYTGGGASSSSAPPGWICTASGSSQVCTAPGAVTVTGALAAGDVTDSGIAASTLAVGTNSSKKLVAAALAGAGPTVQTGIATPNGTPTFTPGTSVTSCGCASGYTCTNTRGEITIVGGTATTGTICTVNFSATLAAAPGLCQVTQEGGAAFQGISEGIPSTSSFTIAAGVSVATVTVTADYTCKP